MKTYKALLQERADLVAEGKNIFDAAEAETRELTAEEKTHDDAINARLDTLRADISREEARRSRELEAATGQRITNVHDRGVDEPWGHKTGHKFGEFMQAVYRHSVGAGTDIRLLPMAVGQGLAESQGADGGFFVEQDSADMILSKAYATGDILSRVKHVPITSGSNGLELNVVDETSRANGSRFGGVLGYWADEAATLGNITRPKFRKIEFKLRKLYALGYATDELLADAGALETIMVDAFTEELKFKVEDAIMRGTGAGQPLGILNAPALVVVNKDAGQAANTLSVSNLANIYAACFAPSRRNAVWLINQNVEPQLEQLSMTVGTGGIPVYLPAGSQFNNLSGEPAFMGMLKGRPVIPTEYNPSLSSVGDIMLVDLSQFMLIDKGGIQNQSSIHVAFNTGETAFRCTYRVDGQPSWFSALTPYQGTQVLSPYVALQAR